MTRGDWDRPKDHWGHDELDGGKPAGSASVFDETAQISGNDTLSMAQGPAALPANLIWPDVDPQIGKTLIDLSMRDRAPRVITVTLGQLGMFVGSWGVPWPRAEVVGVMEIGIGGLLFRAEVDFVQGVQFSLAVSKFKFTAVFRTIPGETTAIPSPAPTVQVGASASIGSLAHGKSPQRTLARANWALGLPIGEFWNVPKFAKSMRATTYAPGFATALGTYLLSTGGAGPCNYVTASPGGIFDYAIPNTAVGVQVVDVAAVPSNEYSLIFDLAV